jgi:hypothetical protein
MPDIQLVIEELHEIEQRLARTVRRFPRSAIATALPLMAQPSKKTIETTLYIVYIFMVVDRLPSRRPTVPLRPTQRLAAEPWIRLHRAQRDFVRIFFAINLVNANRLPAMPAQNVPRRFLALGRMYVNP